MITAFLFIVDVLCISAAAVLAAHFYPAVAGLAEAWHFFWQHFGLFAVVYALWFMVGWSQGMFISHRHDNLVRQLFDVTRAIFVTLVLAYFLLDIITGAIKDNRFAVHFGLLMYLAIAAFRTTLCIGLWVIRRRGFNTRNVLVVGANERTAHLLYVIRTHARFGYRIAGIVDDDPERMKYLEGFDMS